MLKKRSSRCRSIQTHPGGHSMLTYAAQQVVMSFLVHHAGSRQQTRRVQGDTFRPYNTGA